MIRLMSVRKPASALDDREDVLLAHDEELVAVDLELGAGVLRIEDLVPLLDVHRLALPVVEDATGPSGEDLALLGLLLGGVRKDDPALGRLLTGGRLDDDSIAQRAKLGRRGSGGGQRAFLLVSAMAGRRHGLRASAGPWGLVSWPDDVPHLFWSTASGRFVGPSAGSPDSADTSASRCISHSRCPTAQWKLTNPGHG